MVIMMGRSLRTAPSTAASAMRVAPGPELVDVFEHDDAGLHRHAKQRQQADARGHAEVSSGNQQSQQAAERRQRDHAQNEQRPFERAEHGVENDEDDQDRQRDDDASRASARFSLSYSPDQPMR